MKPNIVALATVVLFTTIAIPIVSAESQESAAVPHSTELQIESSRAAIIDSISTWNDALQTQKAKVVKAQKKLAKFASDEQTNQEYIEAKADLETSLALLKIMTDTCLEKIKKLEIND